MEKRINILNLKSKMVRISSEDKTQNSVNNSRFEVNLNQTGANIDRVAGYAVKHISCPNIFYNVPAYANTLQIIKQTGNIIYNILVDPNQYILNDFIIELQTAINTAITPDTVTITANNKNYLNFVFVGDTLFAGSIGRTDFPGGSFEALKESIRKKLFVLGDHVKVYAGHGPPTTIGEERRSNPFVGENASYFG